MTKCSNSLSSDKINELKAQQESYRKEYAEKSQQLRRLQSDKETQRGMLDNQTAAVKALDGFRLQCHEMRAQCEPMREQYCRIRMVSSHVQMSLERLASSLEITHDLMETREELVSALRSVVESLVGNVHEPNDQLLLQQIREGILGIQARTARLWNILEELETNR